MFSISGINKSNVRFNPLSFKGAPLSVQHQKDTFEVSSENFLKAKALKGLNEIKDNISDADYAALKDGILNGNIAKLMDSGAMSMDIFKLPFWNYHPEWIPSIVRLSNNDNVAEFLTMEKKVFESNEFTRLYMLPKEKQDIALSFLESDKMVSDIKEGQICFGTEVCTLLENMPDEMAKYIASDEEKLAKFTKLHEMVPHSYGHMSYMHFFIELQTTELEAFFSLLDCENFSKNIESFDDFQNVLSDIKDTPNEIIERVLADDNLRELYLRIFDLTSKSFFGVVSSDEFSGVSKKIKDLLDEGYDLNADKLQQGAGEVVQMSKTVHDEVFGTDVKITYSFYNDGRIILSRSETDENALTIKGQNKGSNTIFSQKANSFKKNETSEVIYQTEIVSGPGGEPEAVIETKPSEILPGVYDITKYKLSDYPENIDILTEIEHGTLVGGEEISRAIKTPDGGVLYRERLNEGDTVSKRIYKETPSGGYEYAYKIENKGEILLDLKRSFFENSPSETITEINGRRFRTVFDDESMKAVIYNETDGEPPESLEVDFKKKLEENEDEAQREFFEFLKTLPADVLMEIDSVKKVIVEKNANNACVDLDGNVHTVSSLPVLAHELGHIVSLYGVDKISKNPELIKVYNEEMKKLDSKCPKECTKAAEYFLQTGGNGEKDPGLEELTAEALMMFKTYSNYDELYTRAHLLVKYFPKTVSVIAKLAGYCD